MLLGGLASGFTNERERVSGAASDAVLFGRLSDFASALFGALGLFEDAEFVRLCAVARRAQEIMNHLFTLFSGDRLELEVLWRDIDLLELSGFAELRDVTGATVALGEGQVVVEAVFLGLDELDQHRVDEIYLMLERINEHALVGVEANLEGGLFRVRRRLDFADDIVLIAVVQEELTVDAACGAAVKEANDVGAIFLGDALSETRPDTVVERTKTADVR